MYVWLVNCFCPSYLGNVGNITNASVWNVAIISSVDFIISSSYQVLNSVGMFLTLFYYESHQIIFLILIHNFFKQNYSLPIASQEHNHNQTPLP